MRFGMMKFKRFPLRLALLLLCAGATHVVGAQPAPAPDAAASAYAAAAALHNRALHDLAIAEWTSFLERFPADQRADRACFYRGVCYLQAGNAQSAAADFQRVLAEWPKSAQVPAAEFYLAVARFKLAQASGQADEMKAATSAFEQFLARHLKHEYRPQATFYLAESQYQSGQVAEAVATYERFADEFPKHALAADALYALAVAQSESSPDRARQTFRQFVERYPTHRLLPEVQLRSGELLSSSGDHDEAAEIFAKAGSAKDFPLADLAWLRAAESLERAGNLDGAAQRYSALAERFPDSKHKSTALLGAGRCLYQLGNAPAAREKLAPLLSGPPNPETAAAAHWTALSLRRENQPAQAVALADRMLPALAGVPGEAQLRLDRAEALAATPESRESALAAFRELAAKFPDDPVAPRATYLAALTAQQLGRHDETLSFADEFSRKFADDPLKPDAQFLRAESLIQLGKYTEASHVLQTLLQQHSGHERANLWRLRAGWAAHLAGKPDQAAPLLDQVATQSESPDERAEAYFVLGLSKSASDPRAARDAFARSWEASSSWSRADQTLLELASAERAQGDAQASLAWLDRLQSQFPASPHLARAALARAELQFVQGDFAAAAETYRRASEDPANARVAADALLGLAWSQLKQNDLPGCEATATALLEKHPDSPSAVQAIYVRGLARFAREEFAQATSDAREFLSRASDRRQKSDAQYLLGLSQSGAGESQPAVETLSALLRDDPEYAGADKVRFELAWAYSDLGKSDEAVAEFQELANRHPQGPHAAEALVQIGERRYAQDRFADAAAAFQAAVGAAGESPLAEKALHRLAWSEFRSEKWDQASSALAEQLKRFPQGSLAGDAKFLQGEIFFEQEKDAEALAMLASLESTSDPELQALALLHAGQAAARLKDFARSGELLERVAREFPNSRHAPEARYELAWARQNSGDEDAALRLYEEVTAATDREIAARARFMIGEIYFARENHQEAVRNFFKAAYGYQAPRWQAASHYEAGRCFEVLGKKDQARQSYQEVVDKFPQSEQAPLARERLSALR